MKTRYIAAMAAAVSGVVHGNVIELDEAVPALEGRRFRVTVGAVDDLPAEKPAEQQRAWDAWAKRGPQGPVTDDDEPELS